MEAVLARFLGFCIFCFMFQATWGAGPSCPATSATEATHVNLNTADAAGLASGLKGVGKAKAEAIVKWRQEHGKFLRLEQLDEVKGIGPGIIEKNRDRIVFKD